MTGKRGHRVSIPVGRLLRRGAFVAAVVLTCWLVHAVNPPDPRAEFRLLAATILYGGVLALTLLFAVPLTISRLHREARWKRRGCAGAICIVLVANWILFDEGAWSSELSTFGGHDPAAITILLGSIFVLLGPVGRFALDVDAHSTDDRERHSRAALFARGLLVGVAFVACVSLAAAAIAYTPVPPPDHARPSSDPQAIRDMNRYYDYVNAREIGVAVTLLFLTGGAIFAAVLRLVDNGRAVRVVYWSAVFVTAVGGLSSFGFGYWNAESVVPDAIPPWLTLGVVFIALPGLRRVLCAVRAHWATMDHL